MKPFNYLLILLLSFSSWAFEKEGLPEKVSKEIHKEFDVNSDTLVSINNQFGNLNITTWDEDRVVFDIVITVEGKSESKIQEKLEEINIVFKSSASEVSAKTEIDKDWNFSLFKWNKNLKFRINYNVKMPKKNNTDLSNDYGTIALNYLEGKANISCDYGKMIIGELMAKDNALSFDYTSNSTIEYFGGGNISADYSGFSVIEAGNVALSADYSSAKFEAVKTLDFVNDYGKLEINNAASINGRGDYIALRFGTISEGLDLTTDYGSIRVAHIASSAKNVSINSDYTGIKLGVDPQWAFQHEIKLGYAGLSSETSLQHEIQRKESNEKYYEGYHLNANSGNTLSIDSEFGGVKIYNASND